MSIQLGQPDVEKWDWTLPQLTVFANRNFSNDMVNALGTNNQLRLLRNRQLMAPTGRPVRSTRYIARVGTYIPFGLTLDAVPRQLRSGTVLGFKHYASAGLVRKGAFGRGRIRFFFHQLAQSTWLQQQGGHQFAVSLVFMDPTVVQGNWKDLINSDFGTNNPPTPHVMPSVTFNTPSTFPFNMFLLPPTGMQGVTVVSTPVFTKGNESTFQFASQLAQATQYSLPANTDSGVPENLRLVNLFLVMINPLSGGGGPEGPYWLTGNAPVDRWIVNPKAVWTPPQHALPTCFWECVALCVCMRRENGYTFSKPWDLWVHDFLLSPSVSARERVSQMKRIQWSIRSWVDVCRQAGIACDERTEVGVEQIEGLLSDFDFKTLTVLSASGEVIIGSIDGAMHSRVQDNHCCLVLHDGHYSVVRSYTSLLPVKECVVCHERFSSVKTFEKHLSALSCLKCECLKMPGVSKFTSIEQWQHHRANLNTMCEFRLNPPLRAVDTKALERKWLQRRFQHDADLQYKSRAKRAMEDDLFERDLAPFRNHQEAVFFDLESVVPMNGVDVETSDLAFQKPYAAGWIRRTDALAGKQPTLVYGFDCIFQFFRMLDTWWDEIHADETDVMMKRALADLAISRVPRKVRGDGNYAYRIARSWEGVVSKFTECPECQGSVTEETHDECKLKYWAKNAAQKNIMENFNGNAPRISVWAHNGGRYDWLFIHRYLMEENLLGFCRVVRGAGKYYEIAYRQIFLFRDSMSFMMGSLERLGHDFKVETLKGVFPYRYLQDCSHIYDVLRGEDTVRQALPPSLFDISEKVDGPMGLSVKRGMTEDEYTQFMSEREWVYDVEAETKKYLRDDILCLFQVMESFRDGWCQMPYKPELFEYCTIGQMCHTYFLTHFLEPRTYPTLDVMEDTFIRKALYGGRTEVFVRHVSEPLPIHYVDVNSLYPHVMESCDLPGGSPTWYFEEHDERLAVFRASEFQMEVYGKPTTYFESITNRLNACDETLYGFFEVDVVCPPHMEFPVLPERVNDKNMFTNCTKTRMVYYSEELKFAIRRGCQVTRVYGWSQWRRAKVYSQLIQVLKAEKMRGEGKDVDGNVIPGCPKNPSLRAAAKTAQNALYGKSIQFINESVHIVDNQEELFRLIRSPNSDVIIQPIYATQVTDVIEVTVKPRDPKVQRRSCSAIGTAILAEARMVLYSYFEEVMAVDGQILYCDTDSIVFAGHRPLPDRCLDDAVYGKMKVEIPAKDIVPGGFVALAPKCYAFKLVDNSPYVKCKGVNLASNVKTASADGYEELMELFDMEETMEKCGIDEPELTLSGLTFEHLVQMVKGQTRKILTRQMQFLKTRDRHVAAIDMVKLVKDDFDKRRILLDGRTVAWNDVNRGVTECIAKRDVAAVSNFFLLSSPHDIYDMEMRFRHDEWFQQLFGSWMQSGDASSLYYKSFYDV